MLTLTVKEARAGFFDRPAVLKALDKASAKNLPRAGAFVRRTAQFSMRNARRKKQGELTPSEKRTFDLRMRRWRDEGKRGKKPQRPLASSKPGEPPRVVLGMLKSFLSFSYDARSQSVVIGPERLNGKRGLAPRTLERGGTATVGNRRKRTVRIAARPFMGPALEKNRESIAKLWANSVK